MRSAFLAVAFLCSACAAATVPIDDGAEVLRASYAEGVLWQGERLYFAEMAADRVSTFENGERSVFFAQAGCGPTAIAPFGAGFVILCHRGARIVAVDGEGRELQRWDRDRDGVRFTDPNDATEDGRGGVYFSDPGVFSRESRPHGVILHLSAEGEVTRVAGPLWYPNGVFADYEQNSLYVSEHLGGRVLRYDMRADASLAGPSVVADLGAMPRRYRTGYDKTGPDGIEVGPDGNIYVALYGAGGVLRLTREGMAAGFIATPARFTTSIGFNTAGDAAITGVYDTDRPAGEVRVYSRSALTRAIQ